MTRHFAVTLFVLVLLNVIAVIAAPLVAAFALYHGEPGWQGWLYPVMTSGLVISCSLLIVHERLAGRRAPWWVWLTLAASFAFTVWAAIGAVTR